MVLVGRDAELEELRARVESRHLVTVTGPGGIGKTALVRAAFGEAPMVDLTRVDAEDAVFDAFAGQLGFQGFDMVVEGWTGHSILVVDNCEHVLDGAAEAVARLLTVPGLRIVATSRTPLDLPEESVLVLPPLDRSDPDFAASLAVFTQAVIDAGVDPGRLDPDELREICRVLDGVPLALEIAAARLRTLSVHELRTMIETDLAELRRPHFRGRRSHAGISEVVNGSLQLLADTELFECLAVFAGPFTADAASHVASRSKQDVLHGLEDLVHGSLLVAEGGSTARFRMLHPVRAVALERLRASGRLHEISDRFCEYAVRFADEVIERSRVGWYASVLGELLESYGDLAAALRWVLDNDESPDRAFRLLTVLWGVVHQIHAGEVESLGTRALQRWPDPDAPGRAEVVSTVATCRILLGDPGGAEQLILEALAHVPDDSHPATTLHRALAQAFRATNRLEEARRAFAIAADIAAQLGATGLEMESRVGYAMLTAELGDTDEALRLIDEVMRQARSSGASINLAWALACRATVLLRSERPDVDAAAEALDYARGLGYPAGMLASFRVLALTHQALGDEAACAGVMRELVEELRRRGCLNDLRHALDVVADLAQRRGDRRWEDLAATAASLPITTVACPVDHPLFSRTPGVALPLRDAYRTAIDVLDSVIRGAVPSSDSTDASLVLRGDTWEVSFMGETVTVRASKGMETLSRLLAQPGVEFAAVDLMDAGVTVEGSDEVLDATARRRYRDRVRELQEDIEEAEEFGDAAAAERARAEMDALVDQLASATGLGGRSRRTARAAERARSAITHRLRSTVKKVAELHPRLGRHLEASVSTGTFCVYRPESPVRWRVER